MGFRFRRFVIEDHESTMKVGTDSMLLGSWAQPPENGMILDIGTGSGILALMLAQKTAAFIDALETDSPSCKQAMKNFIHSPWADRINLIEGDYRFFGHGKEHFYDFLICNPPFFSNFLKSGESRKNLARHDTTLNNRELFTISNCVLKPNGSFCTVFPAHNYQKVVTEAKNNGFQACSTTAVCDHPGSEIIRYLTEWKKSAECISSESILIIRNSKGNYSEEYLALTRDYHFFNS